MRPVVLVLLVLLGFPATLRAQEDTTARADPSPATDSAAYHLPEIEATAARTGQDPFAVPLATTSVSRKDLARTLGIGLDEALASIPGVVAQSRAGGTDVRLVIRGFGARGAGDRSNSGTTRGIRILVDGMPETEPDGRTSLDAIDLTLTEGIEVIRSNATSLWGNAAGGVVNVSMVPSFQGRFLTTRSMAGAYGLRQVAVRTGVELDEGQAHVAGSWSTGDGWRANSAHHRVLVTAGYSRPLGSRTGLRLSVAATRNEFEIPGPLRADQLATDPSQANDAYRSRHERRNNRLARLGLTVVHRPDLFTEVSATGFVNPKELERSERGTFRLFDRFHRGGSLVARRLLYASSSVATSLLAGIDIASQTGPGRFYSLDGAGNQGADLVADRSEGSRNLGIFVEQAVFLGERVMLNAGARYDAITYEYRDRLEPQLDARKVFSRITPKIAVNWRLSTSHSLYAAIGGGLEAPAGNETDPPSTFGEDTLTSINPLLQPIRSTTYEVGTRQAIELGSRLPALTYDVALYRTEVANEPVPYAGGRFYLTAGRVRRTGVEIGVRADGRRLSLGGGFTYADNHYRRYLVDSVHYGAPGRVADYSGNSAIGTPEVLWTATMGFTPAGPGFLQLTTSVHGSGAYFADDANRIRVPGYIVVSGTIGLARPLLIGGTLELTGFLGVHNVFDRRYVASAFLNPLLEDGVPAAYEPGEPRHLVVSLSLGWQ